MWISTQTFCFKKKKKSRKLGGEQNLEWPSVVMFNASHDDMERKQYCLVGVPDAINKETNILIIAFKHFCTIKA